MEAILMCLTGFFICFFIGSFLNILMNTTKRRDWLITFGISVGVAVIAVPLLNT